MRWKSSSLGSLIAILALAGSAMAGPVFVDGDGGDGKAGAEKVAKKAAKKAALVKQYDANGNGKLDPAEKKRMKTERKALRKANKEKRAKEKEGGEPAKKPAQKPAKKPAQKTDAPKGHPPKADPPKGHSPKADPPKGGGGHG